MLAELGVGTSWQPSNSRRGKHQRQATSQRSCFLGLEVKPELLWDDWDLRRDFTKTLTLKNVHTKLQKLHVRPPESKFFIVSTPQTVALSPGTTFSIPVIFRPLQRCEYDDSIEFQGENGSFSVRLRATLPRHALEAPDSVLLPPCAVQHSSRACFLLRNVSKIQTRFQWQRTAPFQLSPEHGLLKPGQECQISVVFRPREALVYRKQASCRFGGDEDEAGSCCAVLLQGLAKYPHLQLRNPGTEENAPVLDFGSVAVGQSSHKHIDIFNPSPVAATFSLSLLPNAGSSLRSEFSCDVTRGKMVPGGSLQAKVTYAPAVVDTVSVEYLCLKCRGALSEIQLKLTGTCVGPKLSLSSSVVDFDCVEEGGAAAQTVELINSSPVEAIYQWDLDCRGHSVFGIQPAGGTVRPHSQTTLRAVYRPTRPIAHHRRVACLILHRDPVVLDLIGTCHSELQQPVVLKPEHLVLYTLNWSRGQDQPDTLGAMQQDPEVRSERRGTLCSPGESHQRPDSARVSRTPMEEYYQSCLGCSLPSPHVSVVPSELQFNHKRSSSSSASIKSSQCVSITNHASRKLRLVWTAAPDSAFSVSPLTCDLAPLKVTSFRVTYDPKQLNTLHTAQLECFAYHQDNNDIEHRLLSPPWCLTVRVIGHSFQPGKEHFIPFCSLKPPLVVFPSLGVLSYRTVLLQNCGELPLTFVLNHSSAPAESVSLVPSCGLIQPGNHQILTLRATPTEDSPKQGFSIRLQLNAAEHTKELTVISVVERPRVSLEGGGSLYFHPTAVGSRMQRSHHIRNLSNFPLRFVWSVPEPDLRIICVEPEAGELHPNESLAQIWSFNPLSENTYTLTPTLSFWPIQTPGCSESQMTLTVVGTGAKGFIEAERAAIEIGEILVGSCRAIEVPLVNNSPCPVSFSLSVRQTLLDEESIPFQETEPNDLQLTCESGTVASNATMLVRSTLKPRKRAQYLWTISYQMLNASGCFSSLPQAVCEVRAKGVFPTLKVIDARGFGSVGNLSKMHLFKLFALDSLNTHLLSSPSSTELFHKNPSRHSLRPGPSTLDFNFSAAPLNSDHSTFVLMFHNPGSIPVDWAFLFPEEQKMELEYWAETGQLSSATMSQMKVQENHLFSISPRSGTLLPDQQRAVHFTYSHDFVGTDQLPVVFKLSHGREILLNLQGVTVDRDRAYLHFASKRHVFTPVDIGDFAPPRQAYELHNGGSVPVHYKVDLPALSQIQADNSDVPVLSCLNPEGEILPGTTGILDWIFTPLETKTYHMDIPIHVQGGDSTLVRFEGCGLNPSAMSCKTSFNCCDTEVSESCIHKLPFPGQAVFLSDDSLSLGDIPVCARSSRILFLTNTSHTDTYRYAWDQSIHQEIQICPQRGRLCPGESALCLLAFTSADYPTLYRLDVICEVIQEAALTQYHNDLHRWEEEKRRQKNEFPFTDRNLAGSQRILFDKVLVNSEPYSPVRKGPPLRKYKTLPPIGTSRSCETVGAICTKATRAERRAQREASKVWRRPEPPQPLLLHLGITANSHQLLEYLMHFPNQINKHYRCNQPFKPQTQETTFSSLSLPAELPSLTHVSVGAVATHVLTSLLRSIFHDPAFAQFLVASPSKAIAYEGKEPGPSHCSTTPSSLSFPTPPDHTVLLKGAVPQQKEQCNTVVGDGTAGCLGETPRALHAPLDLSEDVLLETLQDLMMEAISGEFALTAHPSTITLPPVPTRRTPKAGTEQREDP
ncbi:cilia- and flagella-associated protein 65 [Brachionichthys hirsutus]|uniref:cilia- and flagella-associated protein 65 n=1 Tax=Brachionichthys hirsutus TaxID=412623 RepID=UPI0036046E4D